jgi:DNA-binding IclR family transcriptional regulator
VTSPSDDAVQHTDVPALRKGLAVLEALASAEALSMIEVQRRAGLNKTMTFRILRTLVETGYVVHDPETRRYALGLRLLEFGSAVTNRLDIVSLSQPLIAELWEAFDETVNLGVLTDQRIAYVAMIESRQGLRMSARPGSRDPLHSTSLGKAMLAFLPDARRDRLIAASLPLARLTPKTIVDHCALLAELDVTRARGYAIDDEENETGAICVGAPILNGEGEAIAGLSISGPVSRINQGTVELFAARLVSACGVISRRMGQPAAEPAAR